MSTSATPIFDAVRHATDGDTTDGDAAGSPSMLSFARPDASDGRPGTARTVLALLAEARSAVTGGPRHALRR